MATATLSLQNNNSIYSSFHTSGTYNPGSGVDLSPTITAASITQDATSATAPSQFPSLHASFNYYLPPADGSRPPATYIDKPETYQQIAETRVMPVQDIRGNEDRYNLDTTGFQVVKHVSAEREFLDEDQIKRVYYPEVEAILKAALVDSWNHLPRHKRGMADENMQHWCLQNIHLRSHHSQFGSKPKLR
jgi:hypothetical protein